MSEEKLLPCPLCHGNNLSHGTVHAGITFGTAGCRDCDLKITSASEAEAITAWNTRPAREEVSGEEVERVAQVDRDFAADLRRTLLASPNSVLEDFLALSPFMLRKVPEDGKEHWLVRRAAEHRRVAIAAMNPKPAEAASGEPVAVWHYRKGHENRYFRAKYDYMVEDEGWTETPLYAHPPAADAAGLREALEAAFDKAVELAKADGASDDLVAFATLRTYLPAALPEGPSA